MESFGNFNKQSDKYAVQSSRSFLHGISCIRGSRVNRRMTFESTEIYE